MRCFYCDFSSDAPSAFHTGLAHQNPGNTIVKLDKATGNYTCSVCSGVAIPKKLPSEEDDPYQLLEDFED